MLELDLILLLLEGWEALVDNKQKDILSNELGMIKIPVKVGNKSITLEYKSFEKILFFTYIIISFLVIIFTIIFLKFTRFRESVKR